MRKSFLYLFVFLVIQYFASMLLLALVKVVGNEAWQQSPYMLIASMLLFAVVTVVVFLRLKWARPTRHYLQSKPWITVCWAVMAAFGTVIPSMAFQEALPELPNWVEAEMGRIMDTPGGYFVVCLLVPLVEELVFRGAILRELLVWKPLRPWLMIAVSALFFSAAHMNPAQMPHAFLIGLLLGWMYWRTGSIVPAVAFHWTNNTIAYILYKLYPDPDLHLIDVLGSQRTVAAAVLFSLFILVPAVYQLHLWMRQPK